jgi:hypothetical protein
MGKLHKIRRAFERLTHDEKMNIAKKFLCWRRFPYGYARKNGCWQICLGTRSHNSYVRTLVAKYHKECEIENRHVWERAYLNGEQWAVDEFNALYRNGGSS